MATSNKAVIVTTVHRGVFFGYIQGEATKEKVVLTQARNCVFWDTSVRGFAGLAATGPNAKCRIGPAVKEMELFDVTCVAECSPEAAEEWEKGHWS